ncbi:MAG: class I adenylate-forming enzyme family protein [Chloroflexota bacterium]
MDIAGNRTLYSIFADHAAREPEREWLVYERGDGRVFRWTFGEFLASVHRAARLLRGLGIGPGDVFNLHLANHPAYPQLILAASRLGAIVMPTNPASTADELRYLLDHSESRLIFTESACLDVAREVAAGRPIVVCQTSEREEGDEPSYETELARQPSSPPPDQGSSDHVVELLYTSGTTARPKGVMLTNANFVYSAEVFRAGSGLRAEDRHLIALPLFHAGAQCHALWPALVADASVAILSRFSASRYFEQAIAYDCTMAALFGAALRLLLNQPARPTDRAHRLRNVTFAQNLTAAQYAAWHRRFGAPLQQIWGMTETCSLPVMSPLVGDRDLLAMGRVVVGYEVRVVDEAGRDVSTGEAGELIVRGTPGRSLMAGYLKNPEATARTIRRLDDGTWLFSGDTARADAAGFLSFVDRGRDLIKRAGENVSSTEVEGVILDCPEVLDVCVVGVPDALRDETVVAVVVGKPAANLTADAVRAFCAARLAPFKVPERVELVDALPRTSVGKIQKQVVRDSLTHGSAGPQ